MEKEIKIKPVGWIDYFALIADFACVVSSALGSNVPAALGWTVALALQLRNMRLNETMYTVVDTTAHVLDCIGAALKQAKDEVEKTKAALAKGGDDGEGA